MRSVEHIKRYTSISTANDQGKTSGVNAIGVIAAALRQAGEASRGTAATADVHDRTLLTAHELDALALNRLAGPVELVAGLAQRLGEALVLRGDPGERPLGVGEPELEAA